MAITREDTQRKPISWPVLLLLLIGHLILGVLGIWGLPRSGDIQDRKSLVRTYGDTENTVNLQTDAYSRTNLHFYSLFPENTRVRLAAWLYKPHATRPDQEKPPIIVMAHGLGGQRDFGLHKYADTYARNGFAVLVFDYRGFGGSDGNPRHLVSPQYQLEDWESAVKFVKSSEMAKKVDASRLMLWGTSYSGGHVLVTASKFGDDIKGVVAQVPHLSARATSLKTTRTRGLAASLRLLFIGILDKVHAYFGKAPVYVKLVGNPGEVAFMALSPQELQAYEAKHPAIKQGGWQNMVTARFALDAPRYSPIQHLNGVKAPVMFVSAVRDALCPHEMVSTAAAMLPNAEHVYLDCDHFSLYLEENWVYTMQNQLRFFKKHANVVDSPQTPEAEKPEVEGSKQEL